MGVERDGKMIFALYLKCGPALLTTPKDRIWLVLFKYLDTQIVKDKEVAVGRVRKPCYLTSTW